MVVTLTRPKAWHTLSKSTIVLTPLGVYHATPGSSFIAICVMLALGEKNMARGKLTTTAHAPNMTSQINTQSSRIKRVF